MTNPVPHIPEDLLKHLENAYPERCAELSWSEREIFVKAGQRQLVNFLRRTYEKQNENILGN